jgi:hypothetical protein
MFYVCRTWMDDTTASSSSTPEVTHPTSANAPPVPERGDYLLSGPSWKGNLPAGMTQMAPSDNSVLVIGRVLVYNDSDLTTAYNLSKQIQLTPLV